jgi:hypothetical protein
LEVCIFTASITAEGKGALIFINNVSNAELTMKKVVNLDDYVAQESEEQAKRALANLNAVAGMLPSPTAAKPSLADLSVDGVDIDDAALAAIEGVATPVHEGATTVAAAPTPTAAAAPASTGDSELDDLLAELG